MNTSMFTIQTIQQFQMIALLIELQLPIVP